MQLLLNSENRVRRTAASSLKLLQFSPSEQINKLFKKIKKRKNRDNIIQQKRK